MLHILNMKQRNVIILILIARTSTICKKYVDRSCSNGRCNSCCAVNDGPQVQTREHIILAKEVGYLIW